MSLTLMGATKLLCPHFPLRVYPPGDSLLARYLYRLTRDSSGVGRKSGAKRCV